MLTLSLEQRIERLKGIRIWNKRLSNLSIPSSAVDCSRPTILGNPFIVGVHGMRGKCCVLHHEWLVEGKHIDVSKLASGERRKLALQRIPEVKGQDLICWCWPELCHCETIVMIANGDLRVIA